MTEMIMNSESNISLKDVVWFKKGSMASRTDADVTVRKGKKTFYVYFRNGAGDRISSTGFVFVGVDQKNNRIVFVEAKTGRDCFTLSRKEGSGNCRLHFGKKEMMDELAKFEGNYNLLSNGSGVYYIDRKQLL